MYTHYLNKEDFSSTKKVILKNDYFKVETFIYASGIEAITIHNTKGYITVLPYYGQIIWDVVFNKTSLTMKNMFEEPKLGIEITDTYGCFAFHSGLLSNGCPSSEDQHLLHGELPCSPMDKSYLTFDENSITIHSEYEYVKGFGHHYYTHPNVTIFAEETWIDIALDVQNRSKYQSMPLQYMCHMNYAYIDNSIMSQNIPDKAFRLRTSIPDHVKPHAEWLKYMEQLKSSKELISILNQPDMYDPEICFFAEHLNKYTEKAEFIMTDENEQAFFIQFDTTEFNYATRWLLNNPDQQVAAFALPATCLPEGYLAAEKANSLIQLKPNEKKYFTVRTGIK